MLAERGVGFKTRRDLDRRSASKLGGIGTGLENRYLDTKRLDLLREGLMERLKSPLRGAVQAEERNAGEPKNTRNTDDMAVALLPQERKRRLDHTECPQEICVKEGAYILLADLLYGADKGVARIVEHDIQATEVAVSSRHRLPDLLCVVDIESERENAIPKALGKVGYVCEFAGSSRDAVAAFERGLCPDTTEAT